MMRAIVTARHLVHSEYGRLREELYRGTSVNPHPAFVQLMILHLLAWPATSKAGNHCSIWESPNRTAVLAAGADASPYTQAPCFTVLKSAWQTLQCSAARS